MPPIGGHSRGAFACWPASATSSRSTSDGPATSLLRRRVLFLGFKHCLEGGRTWQLRWLRAYGSMSTDSIVVLCYVDALCAVFCFGRRSFSSMHGRGILLRTTPEELPSTQYSKSTMCAGPEVRGHAPWHRGDLQGALGFARDSRTISPSKEGRAQVSMPLGLTIPQKPQSPKEQLPVVNVSMVRVDTVFELHEKQAQSTRGGKFDNMFLISRPVERSPAAVAVSYGTLVVAVSGLALHGKVAEAVGTLLVANHHALSDIRCSSAYILHPTFTTLSSFAESI